MMSDIIRMKSVEAVLYGVVKIAWTDGYEASRSAACHFGRGDVRMP